MSELQLTVETIKNYFDSEDSFPVAFDDTWKWLEYSRKDNALVAFMACEFEEGLDFICTPEKSGIVNRNTYSLSCDCLKEWGMMSKTPNGKIIRKYFLECEKIAKDTYKQVAIYKEVDNLVKRLKEIEQLSPVLYQYALSSLGGEPIQQSLDASLVANRLGLAFNKQIKAFEILSDATSPEAFDKLKAAYYQLAKDYQSLMLANNVRMPSIEPDRDREIERIMDKQKLAELSYENSILKEENKLLHLILHAANIDPLPFQKKKR
jgi:phage anti-repressor protein